MNGAELILEERKRQIEKKNRSSEHDDLHIRGELAVAASCYALRNSPLARSVNLFELWPWKHRDWKPKDHIGNLVRAGALIAAEIDRVQRIGQP